MQAAGQILPFVATSCSQSGERAKTNVDSLFVALNSARIIDPPTPQAWSSLLALFPAATPFHSPAWINALVAAYKFKPLLLVFGPEASPRALLPLMEVKSLLGGTRAISLPFTDSCGFLVRASERREMESALTAAISSSNTRRWDSIELRGCQLSGATPSEQFLAHDLDLAVGEATLWKKCSSANQRNITNARKAGVTVRKDNSEAALKLFYRLQCRTRRKHGLPPQPFRFFQAIHEHGLAKDAGSLFLAEHGGRAVAAGLFLHFGTQVVYKYGASDERFLGLRANNLLMWTAIAEYAKAGFQNLSFGRTELFNDGLRRYKMAFGSRECPLPYHCFNYRMNSFIQVRAGALLRFVRPVLRRLPLAAGRLAGSLLYRHAA
jgi:CelD/BcsL family acetyltransferase involved in cellulose biosynthesis